jgi:hypothetical protein
MTRRKPPSRVEQSSDADCIEFTNRTSLHISEQGVGATFVNPHRRQLRKVHYDGCYHKVSGRRQADYIVGVVQVVDVIVELKGSDLKHAVTQVETTLEVWKDDPLRYPRIVRLVVYGHTFPRMNSRLGVIEREFLLAHRTFLWVRENGSEKFKFSKLQGKSR